jgi:hypothetical protein
LIGLRFDDKLSRQFRLGNAHTQESVRKAVSVKLHQTVCPEVATGGSASVAMQKSASLLAAPS